MLNLISTYNLTLMLEEKKNSTYKLTINERGEKGIEMNSIDSKADTF